MIWHETSDLLTPQDAPMQQHAHYARACRVLGSDVVTLATTNTQNCRGSVQVLSKRWPAVGRIAHVARGPAWEDPLSSLEAAKAVRALVRHLRRSHRAVIVVAEPVASEDPGARAGCLPILTHGTQVRLSLDGTPEDRLARQHGKWRNRLRRAQDAGMKIEHSALPTSSGHWLLKASLEQAKREGYRALPPAFSEAWRHVNGPKSTRIFVARHKGEPVAGMLFLLHGTSATYQVGWSSPDGRAIYAHNLLLWTAGEWFAKRGINWVELGLIDTDANPNLARFKLGSGATAHPLGATCLDAPGTRIVSYLSKLGFRSHRSQPVPG